MSNQEENALALRIRGHFLKFISRLNLIEEVKEEAIDIFEALAKDSDFISKSNPKGLAAGIIYVAAILQNDRISQASLSGISGTSESSIHKYYVAIAKKLNLYNPRD
jgi:transcription initiation factor TFIIIB Brf1 subunit/transcription initiation factor TFIIB